MPAIASNVIVESEALGLTPTVAALAERGDAVHSPSPDGRPSGRRMDRVTASPPQRNKEARP